MASALDIRWWAKHRKCKLISDCEVGTVNSSEDNICIMTLNIMNINKQDSSLSTLFNTSILWGHSFNIGFTFTLWEILRWVLLFYLSQRKSFRDDPANFRLSITDKTRSDLTTSLLMIPKVSGCDQGWRLKEDRKVWMGREKQSSEKLFVTAQPASHKHS